MTQPLMPIPPCCPVALLGIGAAPLMVTLLIVSLSLGTSFAQESIPYSRLLLLGCQVLMAAIVAWWIIDQRLLGHAQPVVALVPVADALNHHHQSQVGCRSSIICGLCLTPTHQPGCCHTISHLVVAKGDHTSRHFMQSARVPCCPLFHMCILFWLLRPAHTHKA